MRQVREWFFARSPREQRLLMLMTAMALPILIWLLIVRPLESAYDNALEAQLAAVDRYGRVLALIDAAERSAASPRVDAGADLQLLVTEAALQAGITLQESSPAGLNSVDISTVGTAPAFTAFLQMLEERGLRIGQMRMSPQGDGRISASARVTRG